MRIQRKEERRQTMFIGPRVTKAILRGSVDMKTKWAIWFIKGDDESSEHGDEDQPIRHALLVVPFDPRESIPNSMNLGGGIGIVEETFWDVLWREKIWNERRSDDCDNESEMMKGF